MSEKSIVVVLGVCVLLLGGYAIYKSQGPREAGQEKAVEAIVNRPATEASKDEHLRSFEASAAAAVFASTLEINDCRPNPVGLKIAPGDPLVIENTGLTPAEIRFNSRQFYEVPAGGSLTVNNFSDKKNTILYYLCNGSDDPVGYVSTAL